MKRFAIVLLSLFISLSGTAQKKGFRIDTAKFVLVTGGTYDMGNPNAVEPHEGPVHTVTVSSFYISKTEVTFAEYDIFCSDTKRDTTNARGFGRERQPAITVSWNDAIAYCNWLSKKEKLSLCYKTDSTGIVYYSDTAKGYRLPTEAEWEFAARGGLKSKGTWHAGSNNIDEVGWYKLNAEEHTHPVAQKAPNELGIFDMTGNVWEWVWDYYSSSYYSTSEEVNPTGPKQGQYRVMRGGAFYNYANYAQVYTRQNHAPIFMQNSVGFRIVRSLRQ